jgi:hypothetical protein
LVSSTTRGIDTSADCGRVVIDRSRVSSNDYGVLLGGFGGVTNFTMVNSAVANGGSATQPEGVKMGNASGYFGFNTVYNYRRGIDCNNTLIYSSIIAGNLASDDQTCTGSPGLVRTGQVDIVATAAATGEPKLVAGSNNNIMNVIDKAAPPPTGQSQPQLDYYGTARPRSTTQGYDIGYQQLP